VFAGSLPSATVPAALAVLGIVLTAALFLRALQRLLTGEIRTPTETAFPDVTARELAAVLPLLMLALVLGVYPALILDVIDPAATTLVHLVSR